jgi:hypothetical protein
MIGVKVETPTPRPGFSYGVMGHGTKITTADGHEIKGVREININIAVDDYVRVTAEIAAHKIEAHGELDLIVAHPVTGDLTSVKQITFADGSVWPPVG